MLRHLINRPIAVTMTLVALLIVGSVAIGMLPVSLMPNVAIPQITVKVTLKRASAREVDQSVIKPLRQQLMQLSSLKELRCEAEDGGGTLFLQFEHGSNIDYHFIEVNEKIDRTLLLLPDGMERPKVIKASATDIPAFFIDLTTSENTSDAYFINLSRFAKEVISKRIEQIPQVALVDVSGLLGSQLLVEPNPEKLRSLGLSVADLEKAIADHNISLGNLSIKDGYYQWNIRFDSEIRKKEDIEQINLNIDNRVFLFNDLATVSEIPAQPQGMVRSQGQRSVTMAVIKQSDAQMKDLKKALDNLMTQFSKEYAHVTFTVTRNQTELLDYSISNLKQNILLGAVLAILVIFFFMKDFRSPLLVLITIPLSLVVSLLALYLVGVSINIISLSGLILGLGMMVDNSIIVIDNITQRWDRGDSLTEAVVKGTSEVVAPMLSSVLTTCSVFVPLIFLSGIAGALFFDQAMAVTAALLSSLVVAVTVIPVYYYLLYKRGHGIKTNAFLVKIQVVDYQAFYEKGVKWFLRHQRLVWTLFLVLFPLTYFLYKNMDKSKLPPITHNETVLHLDWNMPLSIEESDRRTCELLEGLSNKVEQSDVMVGQQDFLLSHTGEISPSGVRVYLKGTSPAVLPELEAEIGSRIRTRYPEAQYTFSQSANIFNVIFSENEPDLVAMIKDRNGEAPSPDVLNDFLQKVHQAMPERYVEPVLWQEQIRFFADQEKMALYGLNYSTVYAALSRATKENTLFSIKSGSFPIPVILSDSEGPSGDLLAVTVPNKMGVDIPLSYVLKERRVRDLKKIVSGKDGDYYPLQIAAPNKDIPIIVKELDDLVKEDGRFSVSYTGAYYASREMIKELAVVMVIAILLLFFILAAQFESLIQPIIILSEIVVDLFGAFFTLWICGAGINLMSLIGIVVMCGIIINDSILKVDTINRLRKEGYSLTRAILTGGARRLKPILMTSLTTILAIAPFLVRGNMGADLQFPLSLALIGGMVFGTLVSLFFIPVFYYEIYRRRK